MSTTHTEFDPGSSRNSSHHLWEKALLCPVFNDWVEAGRIPSTFQARKALSDRMPSEELDFFFRVVAPEVAMSIGIPEWPEMTARDFVTEKNAAEKAAKGAMEKLANASKENKSNKKSSGKRKRSDTEARDELRKGKDPAGSGSTPRVLLECERCFMRCLCYLTDTH